MHYPKIVKPFLSIFNSFFAKPKLFTLLHFLSDFLTVFIYIRNMNTITFSKNKNSFFELTPLPVGIIAGCTGRAINSIDYNLANDQIRAQEKEILSSITQINTKEIFTLEQVHGDIIFTIEEIPKEPTTAYGAGDAIITNLSKVCLVIRTADCVPILIADRKSRCIGAVHSGWKGTHLGISGKTIAKMKELYGCAGEDLLAFILPSIGPKSYEVNDDVAQYFPNHTIRQNGKLFVDLWASVIDSLLTQNIPPENIFNAGICNRQNTADFFSHRFGDKGRNLNFIFKE